MPKALTKQVAKHQLNHIILRPKTRRPPAINVGRVIE
jgi:hypothetical protein